jgi:hypothetical protein
VTLSTSSQHRAFSVDDGATPRRGRDGSWAHGDAARPRWDEYTETVAEYDYFDADGVYQCTVRRGVQRKGLHHDTEKRFTVARRNLLRPSDRLEPEDKREWFSGMGDARPTLYRFPELLAASADAPVFICEGEKDVETLREWGLTATCNFGGAEKWRHEYGKHLVGRDVVILPDNDAVGRVHAARVLQSVVPGARSVKVAALPELGDGGDVSDWAGAGGTRDELLRLVEIAPVVTDAAPYALAAGVFATTGTGSRVASPTNLYLALERMGVAVSFDLFAHRYLVAGLMGWEVLDDAALNRLRLNIEKTFKITYPKERFADIITDYARENSVHPVRDYFAGLTWDRKPRLDTWLSDYGGAERTEYVSHAGRLPMIAGVRRIRVPGTKFDTMTVLEGPQGVNKSQALRALAVREEWFSDDLPLDADTRIVMERTAGRLLIEAAELKGMRGEAEKIKAMQSRQVDKARPAYGRMTVEQPRQWVLWGSTNSYEYLHDMTGNRRILPVRIVRFDIERLRTDVDQLWAEAVHRERAGESIELPERLWAEASRQQAEREAIDPFEEILRPLLDGQEGKVRSSDIWRLVGLAEEGKRNQAHKRRLGEVMQKLGWENKQLRFGGTKAYAYRKGDSEVEVPRNALFGSDGDAM